MNEEWKPYGDQWAYLASIRRLEVATVETLVAEASRHGQVLGVRGVGWPGDEAEFTPWTRPPSGRSRPIVISGPLPSEIHALLAQRLFIAKAGLPPALLNQIKRLAAFQNPEFYLPASCSSATRIFGSRPTRRICPSRRSAESWPQIPGGTR